MILFVDVHRKNPLEVVTAQQQGLKKHFYKLFAKLPKHVQCKEMSSRDISLVNPSP